MNANDASPVTGVTLVVKDRTVTVVGLGNVVKEMANDPLHNYGFRVEFESKSTFYSSEGYGHGPKLSVAMKPIQRTGAQLSVLSLEPKGDPGKPSGWTAKVQNVGDAVATGVNAVWSIRGERKGTTNTQQALAPGDTAQIEWGVSTAAEKASPDVAPLSIEVMPGGTGGTSNPQSQLSVPITGLAIRLELDAETRTLIDAVRGTEPMERYLHRLVSFVNSGVLAQSRTTFSPEGCRERFRLVTGDSPAIPIVLSLKQADQSSLFMSAAKQIIRAVSPYKGMWATPPDSNLTDSNAIGWLPDTRDDSLWPFALMLPNFPWAEPKPLQSLLPARGLLSRAEVASLNELVGIPASDRATYVPAIPTAAILSFADMGGNPLAGAAIEAFPTIAGKLSSEPVFKGLTTAGGKIFLSGQDGKGVFGGLQPDGSNAWLLLRITRDFVTETAWFPAWNLATERARGNANVPTVEVRVMMPSGTIKSDEDLAQNKTVSDSLERFPAELAAVVDNNPITALEVKGGTKPYWLEIDLGRDRLVGAVEIETQGSPLEKFEITTIKTGQKPIDAQVWVKEVAGTLRMQQRGIESDANNVLVYTATAVRSRYLRINVVTGSPTKIAAIRVRTLQQRG